MRRRFETRSGGRRRASGARAARTERPRWTRRWRVRGRGRTRAGATIATRPSRATEARPIGGRRLESRRRRKASGRSPPKESALLPSRARSSHRVASSLIVRFVRYTFPGEIRAMRFSFVGASIVGETRVESRQSRLKEALFPSRLFSTQKVASLRSFSRRHLCASSAPRLPSAASAARTPSTPSPCGA